MRAQPKLKLPTADLLALFAAAPDAGSADSAAAAAAAAASAQAAAMVRNFALVYLEMAAERADSQEQLAMVPTLLQVTNNALSLAPLLPLPNLFLPSPPQGAQS